MKNIIATLATLILMSGCDSSSKPSKFANTYSISGTISGLTGEITLELNGTDEVLTSNGSFTFSTRVTDGESYIITEESNSNDLTCTITNDEGISDVNVTDVLIECNGTDQVAYSLNGLAFNTETPSIVTFAFHLVDRYTEAALDNITTDNLTDYLNITENDSPISPSESFLEIDQISSVNAQYNTVFAIDISYSLLSDELESIKNIISNNIVDELTGESKLSPNQYVTIITFDSEVETVVTESQDTTAILNALDLIGIGGNSTNLYGAIKEGVDVWHNEISLDKLEYGNLILFTDGIDTSDKVSKSSALNAVENKDVYFIALGNEVNTIELQDFTNKNNIFNIDDFSQLSSKLDDALARIKTFEDGLYIMSYATPKRAGSHTITITAKDDYRCDAAVNDEEANEILTTGDVENCNDQQSYTFNANNFEDVTSQLTLSGATPTVVNEVVWTADLRWTNDSSTLNWQINICTGDIDYTISDDNTTATLVRTSDEPALAYISVTDSQYELEQEAYAIMAKNQSEFILSATTIQNLCSQ